MRRRLGSFTAVIVLIITTQPVQAAPQPPPADTRAPVASETESVVESFSRQVPLEGELGGSLGVSEIDAIPWELDPCSQLQAHVDGSAAKFELGFATGIETCEAPADWGLDLGPDRVSLPLEVLLTFRLTKPTNANFWVDLYLAEASSNPSERGSRLRMGDDGSDALGLEIFDERFGSMWEELDVAASVVSGYSDGDVLKLRARIDPHGLHARAWRDGTTEPTTWQVEYQDEDDRDYDWAHLGMNVSGSAEPDAWLYVDELEIVTGYTTTLNCDDETYTVVGPRVGDIIPISARYDPRFLIDPRLDEADELSLAMVNKLRERADTAFRRYDALGFDLPDEITIELDCEPDWLNFISCGRNACVFDSALIQIRSEYVRDQLAEAALGDFTSGGAWDAVGAAWKNLVDHESFHTIQHLNSGLGPEQANSMFTLIESPATLGQDLQTDTDDASTPDGTGSYLDSVEEFHLDLPSVDERRATWDQPPSAYMAAGVLQYWGERFGPQDESDLEQRVARFVEVLTDAPGWLDTQAGSMADALGHDYATGATDPADLANAVRDYLIAAYALRASNVSPTENEMYAILDAEEGATAYPAVAVDGTLDLTSGPDSTDDTLELDPFEGDVFEIPLPSTTVAVTLDIERDYVGLPGRLGPDLRAAALPMGADDSLLIDSSNMFHAGDGSRTIPVGGRERLVLVVVAGDDHVSYNVSAEAHAGQVGMSFSYPTVGSPHCSRIGHIMVEFGLTVDGAPIAGETGAAFDLTVGGQGGEISTVRPIPGGYRLTGWAPSSLGAGLHGLSLAYGGQAFTVPGGLRIDPSCGSRQEQVELAEVPSLSEEATATAEATISGDAASATFMADWLGSDVDLTVTSPSDRIIDEATAAGDVSISHTADTVTITVDDPEAGVWDIELYGDDLPQPEPVVLTVSEADASVSGESVVSTGSTAGLPFDVITALGAPEALEIQSVTASVTDPAGAVRVFRLFDDGGHRDAGASDGVYGARVFGTDLTGTYRIELRAAGTDADGAPFSRVHVDQVSLGAKVDADDDGVADGAEPDLGLDPGDPADGDLDNDNDGLSIAEELATGSDRLNPDTDAGGESDGSEVADGRDPLDASDDTSLPPVALLAVPRDGVEVALEANTEDDGSEIRLYRGDGLSWSLLDTYTGPTASPIDTLPAAGDYWYAASTVASNGAESPLYLIGPISAAEDVTPPEARLLANGGRWEAHDDDVLLRFIDLTEPAAEMRVALSGEDLENATWEPFSMTTEVEIEMTLGLHSIYAQVRDAAGHSSPVLQAPIIIVDIAPPESTAYFSAGEYDLNADATVEIEYDASDPDDLSTITSVELWWRQRPDDEGQWTTWALGPSVESSGDPLFFDFPSGTGMYEIYTVATDAAGNREAPPEEADSSTVAVERATSRISVATGGTEADAASGAPAVSVDGRFVAFASTATNLVGGDTNGVADVFVHDRQTGSTSRVSVGNAGAQANAASLDPDMSADGRYVVFTSAATNLVSGDTNAADDVFLHDRQAGSTVRISVASSGAQSDGASDQPAISADSTAVGFRSTATDLVAGDTNGVADIFVRDLSAGTTSRVSVNSSGAQANAESATPAIDAAGSVVAFESSATNLVASDTNGLADVFVRDLPTAATTRASVTWDGIQGDEASTQPAIAGDGLIVAFTTGATTFDEGDTNGLPDVYVHQLDSIGVWRVSRNVEDEDPDGASLTPSISDDGRYVAFVSSATDLIEGDANAAADVFVHDLERSTTSRWSLTSVGAESSGVVSAARISGDAKVAAFISDATDLVATDTNGVADVFVRAPQ